MKRDRGELITIPPHKIEIKGNTDGLPMMRYTIDTKEDHLIFDNQDEWEEMVEQLKDDDVINYIELSKKVWGKEDKWEQIYYLHF